MRRLRTVLIVLLAIIAVLIVGYLALIVLVRPSLTRDWSPDNAVLATSDIGTTTVTIHNIRNIEYRTKDDYDLHYYDKTFNLDSLESVWYMVEPFSGHGAGAAHTLLSFGFSDGSYVAISVELRKERGEKFSPWKGVLRQYELFYVIADERDVLKLRSNYRHDEVYLYPVIAGTENMRTLFLSMLERANRLTVKPEFYNTLTNTCTTNIVAHVNAIVPGRIPWSFKVLMPAYSDILARKVGLIDPSLTIEELRAKYRINDKALKHAEAPDFSARIRE